MHPYLSSGPPTMNTMVTKALVPSEGDCGAAGIRSCSVRVMNGELQSEHTFCENSSLCPCAIVSLIGRMYHYSPNDCFRQIVYLGCSKYHVNIANRSSCFALSSLSFAAYSPTQTLPPSLAILWQSALSLLTS